MSINKFVNPGFFLSIDLFLVSAINWVYWLLISSLTYPGEIGKATSVYSFVILISAITTLGLEYSLVKKSSSLRSHILGTSIVIELFITAASIPLIFYFVNSLYEGSLSSFAFLAVGLLIFYSQRNIMRFILLGNRDATNILRINLSGSVLQLVTGYIMVYMGYGAAGILSSFLVQFILVTVLSFVVARKSFEFRITDLRYAKEILMDALANTPNSLSKVVIYTLSVVLLASIGVNQSDIGTYYIALMISLIAGGFAGNIALMVIPASSIAKFDLSVDSTRLGLSFTAPIVVALMVAPASILGIIGPEYSEAGRLLLVLAVAIVPYVIVVNAISKFNNLGNARKIISLGSIQLVVFLLSFFSLTPYYGTMGSALAILLASVAAAIPAMVWSERLLLTYVFRSCISLTIGLVTGYIVNLIAQSNISPAISIASAIAATMSMILLLKVTSVNEISVTVADLMKKSRQFP
jgi:O-antigen/teichoic acid export membrane protein